MTTNDNLTTESKQSKPNIELGLVRAWQNKAWWLWLLWPLSLVYGGVSLIRRKLYQSNKLSSYRAPVPVMVVGNITVGGSGKTPLIIELVHYLQQQGIKVGVISRGYGGDESIMPQLVSVDSQPSQVGDEPCLIVRETGVVMAVCPNRQLAIECILQHAPDTQLIVADDGLQHYKLQRDIEWIVVDSDRGFGNKQLLPTGFLREPISRLKEATVLYHHSANHPSHADSSQLHKDDLVMQLLPAPPEPLDHNSPAYQDKPQQPNADTLISANQHKVYAMSGIGYPKRFFDTLRSLGFEVIEKPMPDHHDFSVQDLQALTDYPIVITSKDAVKVAPLVANNPSLLGHLSIWVLPVRAQLSQNSYQTLMQQLKALGVS